MTLNHRHSPLLFLTLLAVLLQPSSIAGTGGYRPATDPSLGHQIAEQGNRALLEIRSEAWQMLQPATLEALTVAPGVEP